MSDLYLYHATDSNNVDSILKNGLLCNPPKHNWDGMTTNLWGNFVFLALDANAAESYVEEQDEEPEDIAVFKINLENLDESLIGYDWNNRCGYHNEINSVVYNGDIPAKYLELCDVEKEPFQELDSFEDTLLYERVMTVFEEEVESNMENEYNLAELDEYEEQLQKLREQAELKGLSGGSSSDVDYSK